MALKEMDFLDNPSRRGKRKRSTKAGRSSAPRKSKRRPPGGFKSWGAYMASIRPKSGGAKMARKRKAKARGAHRRNPPAARRHHKARRYRRNPVGLSGIMGKGRGMLNRVVELGIDAAGILGGKMVARKAPTLAGFTPDSWGAVGAAILGGAAAGFLADKVRPGLGRFVLASAVATAVEPKVKAATATSLPAASNLLGDYYMGSYLMAGAGMGLYPSGAAPSLAVPPSALAGSRRFSDSQEYEA